MNAVRYRCRLFESYATDARRLVLIRDSGPGKIELATGFTWREESEGAMFALSEGIERADDFLQPILNEAWDKGMRPAGFADVKNETAAIRDHLADMKAIAFHQLKIRR
jgi:hypothetical protein